MDKKIVRDLRGEVEAHFDKLENVAKQLEQEGCNAWAYVHSARMDLWDAVCSIDKALGQ